MIHSMTGFGESRVEEAGRVYHLELRSFNQRYLKTALHLPEDFAFLESEVERLLRQRLTRGSVTLRLHVRDAGPQAALELNTAAVQAYVAQLRAAAGRRSARDDRSGDAAYAAGRLPDAGADRVRAGAALGRRCEADRGGAGTADRDAGQRGAGAGRQTWRRIATSSSAAWRRCGSGRPSWSAEYRDRLKARVEELIADSSVRLAEDDLLKEVSIYAERSDISEELSRLAGHRGAVPAR